LEKKLLQKLREKQEYGSREIEQANDELEREMTERLSKIAHEYFGSQPVPWTGEFKCMFCLNNWEFNRTSEDGLTVVNVPSVFLRHRNDDGSTRVCGPFHKSCLESWLNTGMNATGYEVRPDDELTLTVDEHKMLKDTVGWKVDAEGKDYRTVPHTKNSLLWTRLIRYSLDSVSSLAQDIDENPFVPDPSKIEELRQYIEDCNSINPTCPDAWTYIEEHIRGVLRDVERHQEESERSHTEYVLESEADPLTIRLVQTYVKYITPGVTRVHARVHEAMGAGFLGAAGQSGDTVPEINNVLNFESGDVEIRTRNTCPLCNTVITAEDVIDANDLRLSDATKQLRGELILLAVMSHYNKRIRVAAAARLRARFGALQF